VDTNVMQSLNDVEASYEIIDCDPSFADTAAFCNRYGYLLKNLRTQYCSKVKPTHLFMLFALS